ncbi:MAG: translocation/assembly module TamB domain-containing protein [Proteobacteria bacterium]|nr:translocation/assembly module TamB domain-containing protein [Pseudomonadota bacterium]
MSNLFINWLKALFRWITLLVMIPLLLLAFFLTPMGLKVSFHIFSKLVPGQLTYQQITGTFIGPITIKKFNYRYQDQQVAFKRLYLQWRPSDLLEGRVYIKNLVIDSLVINTPQAPTPPSQKTYTQQVNDTLKTIHAHISTFHMPFKLRIDRGVINNLTLQQHPGEPTISATGINLQKLNLEPDHITGQLWGNLLKPYPFRIVLTLNGSPKQYSFKALIDNANTHWLIIGQGNPHEVELDTPQTTVLGGQIAAHLHFLWQEHTPWQLIVRARKLDFSSLNPSWPHPIDMDLDANGLLNEDQPAFAWTALIKSPKSQVYTKGKYDKLWDIDWNLQVKELAELLPHSSGVLVSTGELHGSLSQPRTKGNLQAGLVRWHDYRADRLDATWNIDASEKTASFIQINAEQIGSPWAHLEKLLVDANGKLNQHQLSIKAHGYNADIQLNAAGSWEKNQWIGSINNLIMDLPIAGKLQSTQPAALQISQKMADLSALCLLSANHSELCLHGKWNGTNNAWQLAATGSITFAEFASLAPQKLKVNLPMAIHMNIEGLGKTLEQVQLQGSTGAGDITYNSKVPATIHIISSQLLAKLSNNDLDIDFNTQLAGNNSISAKLVLPKFSQNQIALTKDQAILGNIALQVNNLSPIQGFLPEDFILKGSLQGNFDISGTLGAPILKGSASLAGGELKLFNHNLSFEHLHFDLTGHDQELDYILTATSNNQPLKVEGKTVFGQPGGIASSMTLTGNSILFADTTDYTIYISPNMTFFIKDSEVDIGGSLDISKAVVRQLELQNETTLPTGEVVFVGEQQQEKKNPLNLNMNLVINLGKDIKIDTPGIKGNLSGNLTLTLKPGQVLLGSGKIEISNGIYSIYGRELTIAPGSNVVYRGTPLNNPYLNIQATTRIEVTDPVVQQQLGTNELTVGMNIGGSVTAPQITLFSSAGNLSQADILSFLVLGTSSAGISPYNMELMLKASQTLPLTKKAVGSVEGITNQVKQSLGLTELGVESAPTFGPVGEVLPTATPTSYFVIGKRLTSRLYFRYRYDPFNSVNLFQLIYTITKNLSLQLETDGNTQSGADLLYTIQAGSSKAANKISSTTPMPAPSTSPIPPPAASAKR